MNREDIEDIVKGIILFVLGASPLGFVVWTACGAPPLPPREATLRQMVAATLNTNQVLIAPQPPQPPPVARVSFPTATGQWYMVQESNSLKYGARWADSLPRALAGDGQSHTYNDLRPYESNKFFRVVVLLSNPPPATIGLLPPP